MLAFAFKGIGRGVRNRLKGMAALIAKFTVRPVLGLTMAALNRRHQRCPAVTAFGRFSIDRTVALGAYHEWWTFSVAIISLGELNKRYLTCENKSNPLWSPK
jgi:hypothetical protein